MVALTHDDLIDGLRELLAPQGLLHALDLGGELSVAAGADVGLVGRVRSDFSIRSYAENATDQRIRFVAQQRARRVTARSRSG